MPNSMCLGMLSVRQSASSLCACTSAAVIYDVERGVREAMRVTGHRAADAATALGVAGYRVTRMSMRA